MSYTQTDIENIVAKQRKYFRSGATLPLSFRIRALKKLRDAVILYENELEQAMYKDLGRCPTEAYLCDIGDLLSEINETIHGLKKWARPEKHLSGLACFPSIFTKVYKMPYGVALIISPFNFPILLSLGVLTAAIAGGNTAVIKPSSKSSACTAVIIKITEKIFDEDFVKVIDGGHDTADYCLNTRFDKIFYTGSPKVAVHVMERASAFLTPVALELGGEAGNWCVIRKDADLRDAARKIAFFKALNAGQICININQVAVAEEVSDEFTEYLKQEFIRQLGEKPLENAEYPRLISKSAFDRCKKTAEQYREKTVFGGHGDGDTLKFEPTVIYPVSIDDSLVQSELFCPILPIVPYPDKDIDKLTDIIESREHGLALYVFTKNMSWANRVMAEMQFGGGCINEVVMHLMVKGVPFNGTGHSGMGAYHGEWGFREFTHPKTVLKGSTRFNLPVREHPYTGKKNEWKFRLLKKLEK